jgi:DNA-binding response OmpR family regulator
MPARILVVEATREVRALIADVLVAVGHEVTSVAHGAAALVLTEWPGFDLILSNLTMPAVEGAQLYWEIGARWPDLASRVICVTDGHDAGAIDHARLREASVPFLVKPFLPEHLLDVVTRTLARGTP